MYWIPKLPVSVLWCCKKYSTYPKKKQILPILFTLFLSQQAVKLQTTDTVSTGGGYANQVVQLCY